MCLFVGLLVSRITQEWHIFSADLDKGMDPGL